MFSKSKDFVSERQKSSEPCSLRIRTFGTQLETQGIRNIKDVPENAKKYILAIEDFIGAKISSISTSPERDDTILVKDPFDD